MEKNALGKLLPTICVSMIPLQDHCPTETNQILEYLIIRQKNNVAEYLPELFFIEEMKISPNMIDTVKECIKRVRYDIEGRLFFFFFLLR